eukprot:GHVU01061020.1.p1 GENE.GHVU01061020.1~~GHVU01061020.1.p1  ORF type:complete len:109 (-),score=2.38 GHVU01061020.1:27-305(-)
MSAGHYARILGNPPPAAASSPDPPETYPRQPEKRDAYARILRKSATALAVEPGMFTRMSSLLLGPRALPAGRTGSLRSPGRPADKARAPGKT